MKGSSLFFYFVNFCTWKMKSFDESRSVINYQNDDDDYDADDDDDDVTLKNAAFLSGM